MKPRPDENILTGRWIKNEDGRIVGDATCRRIDWLTESFLELVKADGVNWLALYKNPEVAGEYWELTYPQSHMHGGGPPELVRISAEEASKKYGSNP